jgi:hypothetical protein
MTTEVPVGQKLSHMLPTGVSIGFVLGPLVGLVIWGLRLQLVGAADKAFAIVGFMAVYWITEDGMDRICCFFFTNCRHILVGFHEPALYSSY